MSTVTIPLRANTQMISRSVHAVTRPLTPRIVHGSQSLGTVLRMSFTELREITAMTAARGSVSEPVAGPRDPGPRGDFTPCVSLDFTRVSLASARGVDHRPEPLNDLRERPVRPEVNEVGLG